MLRYCAQQLILSFIFLAATFIGKGNTIIKHWWNVNLWSVPNDFSSIRDICKIWIASFEKHDSDALSKNYCCPFSSIRHHWCHKWIYLFDDKNGNFSIWLWPLASTFVLSENLMQWEFSFSPDPTWHALLLLSEGKHMMWFGSRGRRPRKSFDLLGAIFTSDAFTSVFNLKDNDIVTHFFQSHSTTRC